MHTTAAHIRIETLHPVDIRVPAQLDARNRLTVAFRPLLALPHLLLVGAPLAAVYSWSWSSERGFRYDWGAGGGALGAVALVCTFLAWFAVIFTARHPVGLWNLAAFYLRWRVRAVAYASLLRDEFPPFGDGEYPVSLVLADQPRDRNRLTIAFRIFLALPHLIVVFFLSLLWFASTVVAWFSILLTGKYPRGLYEFGYAVFRWNVRVEAYLLLLHDEYPPFDL